MACIACACPLEGWITWRRSAVDPDVWIAYCTECTESDPEVAQSAPDGSSSRWTLRVRCSQCRKPTQSCREKGSGPIYCLRANGWQRSTQNKWYCPEHAAEFLAASKSFDARLVTCACKHLVDDGSTQQSSWRHEALAAAKRFSPGQEEGHGYASDRAAKLNGQHADASAGCVCGFL